MKYLRILLAGVGFSAGAAVHAADPVPSSVTQIPSRTVDVGRNQLTVQPESGAVSPANIRRDVIAAVEQVLALHGNPPFAELVTNDSNLAASLRERLDAVRDREKLTKEVTELTARKSALLEELARKEAELAYAREQTAKLSATIQRVTAELDRIKTGMASDAAPASAAVLAPAAP